MEGKIVTGAICVGVLVTLAIIIPLVTKRYKKFQSSEWQVGVRGGEGGGEGRLMK